MNNWIEKRILNQLFKHKVKNIVGVPDSTLQGFVSEVELDPRFESHISTNECEAISIAMGQYLGSGVPSLVYLQNSGFGKTIHPFTSLLHPDVYHIPIILMIGWRGHPEFNDEPQHKPIGKLLPNFLKDLGIASWELSASVLETEKIINLGLNEVFEKKSAVAFLIPPDLFTKKDGNPSQIKNKFKLVNNEYLNEPNAKVSLNRLTRKDVVSKVVEMYDSYYKNPKPIFASTTGLCSRELFEIQKQNEKILTYYNIGGMGCVSSIALGISMTQKNREVCVLDGDGALLMQMGTLASLGSIAPINLTHILIDNECHESTGGQETVSRQINLSLIAEACGYRWRRYVETEEEMTKAIVESFSQNQLKWIHVKCKKNAINNQVGRPDKAPEEMIQELYKNIQNSKSMDESSLFLESLKEKVTLNNKCKTLIIYSPSFKNFYPKRWNTIINLLSEAQVLEYSSHLLNWEDIESIQLKLKEYNQIVAIGGGTVMDLSKILRSKKKERIKLIVIPTTFGTGAEITPFATYYNDKVKQSEESIYGPPDEVVCSPEFYKTLTQRQLKIQLLDILGHSIESITSNQKTIKSETYSLKALLLINPYLKLNDLKLTQEDCLNLYWAGHFAGLAISDSKTNLGHALSYYLTAFHNLEHGLSVGFLLPIVLKYLKSKIEENEAYQCIPSSYEFLQLLENWGLINEIKEKIKNKISIPNWVEYSLKQPRIKNIGLSFSEEELKVILYEYLNEVF